MAHRPEDPEATGTRDLLLAVCGSLAVHALLIAVVMPGARPIRAPDLPVEPLVVELTSPPGLTASTPREPTTTPALRTPRTSATRTPALPAASPSGAGSAPGTGTRAGTAPSSEVIAPRHIFPPRERLKPPPEVPPTSGESGDRAAPPAGGAANEPLVEARAVDPKNPAPDYPEDSRRRKEEGLVYLRLRISARGRVESVEVERSSGFEALDEAASKAVILWTFEPAHRGAAAVASLVTLPIRFRLDQAFGFISPPDPAPAPAQ